MLLVPRSIHIFYFNKSSSLEVALCCAFDILFNRGDLKVNLTQITLNVFAYSCMVLFTQVFKNSISEMPQEYNGGVKDLTLKKDI